MDQASANVALTQPSDWDQLYDESAPLPEAKPNSAFERYFWGEQLPALLPRLGSDHKLIELGSAPGRYALILSQITGAVPHGVEYTASGAAMNRRNFAEHGVSPDNVFEASFLDPEFRSRQRESYDLVSSFGLIEHFSDPVEAVAAHIDLLKPGGTLVISIPNLRGFTGLLKPLMAPRLTDGHNVEIMRLPVFRKLFARPDLEVAYIGMAARFHFYFTGPATGLRRFLQLVAVNLESPLHRLMAIAGKILPMESRFFSPYLLCVARKR